MKYERMPIEIEAPEQIGYENIDCNLTESSYTDVIFKELDLNLNELAIAYGDHIGHPGLRGLLAEEYSLHPDDVLLTVGAASALFIISTSLLDKGDELVVIRPNYATNIVTPRAIGAEVKIIDLTFENGFQLNVEDFEKTVTPKTKFISITTPHNPTGVCYSQKQIEDILAIAEKNDAYLLVDETYRDMAFDTPIPLAATLSERVISVSSLSKTYGLPGIRLGWLITKNKKLMETFLAAKEQIFICGSVVDEEIGYRYYKNAQKHLPTIKADIKAKFEIIKEWMTDNPYLEWVEPSGGVVCFPRMKVNIDPADFYQTINQDLSTYVGPGHWFEMDDRYMRIGFGWPSIEVLKDGLARIEKAFKQLV